jgi:hypothetical protein
MRLDWLANLCRTGHEGISFSISTVVRTWSTLFVMSPYIVCDINKEG